MKPTEIVNLFKKSAETRMDFFLKTVGESKTVYGLADEEGWALLGNEDIDEEDDPDILPLFPNASLAEAFRRSAGFAEMKVEKMSLQELSVWLEELEEEGALVAVLPNPDLEGMVISVSDFSEEISKFL
jgi:hypothetical protein